MEITDYLGASINLRKTGFMPGLGVCLDIRFTRSDSRTEHKRYIPLNKIRLITPHTTDRAWTRIFYGENDDSYFAIPITYDKLIEFLEITEEEESYGDN